MEITLDNSLKSYLIEGLDPGEAYDISLKTTTGVGSLEQESRKDLGELVLTKPLPLDWIFVETNDEENGKVTVLLNPQDDYGHSKLKGFYLQLNKIDGEIKNLVTSMSVLIAKDAEGNAKDITRVVLDKLKTGTDYEVAVKAISACKNPNLPRKLSISRQKSKFTKPKFHGREKSKFSTSCDTSIGWDQYITCLSSEKTMRFTTGKFVNHISLK